jgi:hypothetical protein
MEFTYRGRTYNYFPTVEADFRELDRYIQDQEMPELFFKVIWENQPRKWWKLLVVGTWIAYDLISGAYG